MNRKAFFDNIRPFFDGFKPPTGQGQIQGLDAILDEADTQNTPVRHLAYMLATAFHETNATMQPVREAYWLSEIWRKLHLRYYPYYGRGLVQLTWKKNYAHAGDILNVDLVHQPDLALDLATAVRVMFDGMEQGWFTGKKLSDYPTSYTRSRRIINGTDRAALIATYAERFETALNT